MDNIRIEYISNEHFVNSIKNNLWKIPYDVDLVVGIPRAGMLAASLISELRQIPLTTIDDFYNDYVLSSGISKRYFKNNEIKNVLIIDDTVWSGNAINQIKDKIKQLGLDLKYNILYSCVFLEGLYSDNCVDIFLEDVRNRLSNYPETFPIVYGEWNIFHKGDYFTEHFMFDMDGILCQDPIEDNYDGSNVDEYINSIKTVLPLWIPSTKIGTITSYRLNKYRDITETWLKKYGVTYNNLILVNANNNIERGKVSPSDYKSLIYSKSDCFLFIESNEIQAQEICYKTHKPVYSMESNCVYNFKDNTIIKSK